MDSGIAQSPAPRAIAVEAPGRLHMGFLDLNGGLGRRFGSVGLALEGISTRVVAWRDAAAAVSGPQAERVRQCMDLLRARLHLPPDISIAVEEAIPEHVGLGSGTQLALAVGVAVARLAGLGLGARQVAALLDRGARSGIGIGAFERGGFLIDGGRGRSDSPPPITVRAEFPEQWRVLLIFDGSGRGLHGSAEREAFRLLPPFPEESAGRLCHLMLMHALPALAEHDLEAFGYAVTELQRVVGDHFAPAQGGRFASARVAEVLGWLEGEGVACLGQSSWGPTGFGVMESEERAQALAEAAGHRWGGERQLSFAVCRARNHGGSVNELERAGAQVKHAAGG